MRMRNFISLVGNASHSVYPYFIRVDFLPLGQEISDHFQNLLFPAGLIFVTILIHLFTNLIFNTITGK